jgi:hypothetical protein
MATNPSPENPSIGRCGDVGDSVFIRQLYKCSRADSIDLQLRLVAGALCSGLRAGVSPSSRSLALPTIITATTMLLVLISRPGFEAFWKNLYNWPWFGQAPKCGQPAMPSIMSRLIIALDAAEQASLIITQAKRGMFEVSPRKL